jgi:hypothetical protein
MDKRIQREYRDSDGYWIELAPGWQNGADPGTHGIVEDTKRAARAKLSMATPCDCAECRDLLAKAARTFTARDTNGKVWYASRPHGNLMGELPLGARPIAWGNSDEPWDGARFTLESGREIIVTMDRT